MIASGSLDKDKTIKIWRPLSELNLKTEDEEYSESESDEPVETDEAEIPKTREIPESYNQTINAKGGGEGVIYKNSNSNGASPNFGRANSYMQEDDEEEEESYESSKSSDDSSEESDSEDHSTNPTLPTIPS